MSEKPFKTLVKLVARAFYDEPPKVDIQRKPGRSDNKGIGVVILDALTRRQWVKEEDLAKDLRIHLKLLRRLLRHFEEEKLINREHRRETIKGAKVFNAAVAATIEGQEKVKEGEEKQKLQTQSYCCLDYAQIYDVVRYRIRRMRMKLKDSLEDRKAIREYICPKCSSRYSDFDTLNLISPDDDNLHCENCNAEIVVAEAEGKAQRGDKAIQSQELLEKMEEQLQPLIKQLTLVKDLPVPDFGTLLEWEVRVLAGGQAISGDANANNPSQGQGYAGKSVPFIGETKVEVALGEEVRAEETKEADGLKALPPWMIKEGMNLTDAQRGEAKFNQASSAADSKPTDEDKKEVQLSIQEEYYKAYYAELLKMQQSSSVAVAEAPSDRSVGMKAKREVVEEEEEEEEEDVEWEEDPTAGGTTSKAGEVGSAGNNLDDTDNQDGYAKEENASEEEDGDDIDWEEA